MNLFRDNWFSKLFDNNLFVKVLSVVIAVISWFLVAVFVSEDARVTIYNVPVTIDMENSSAQLLGLEPVEGNEQTVNVTVQGKRYQVGALTADSFEVVALPSAVTSAGTYELEVTVRKKVSLSENTDYQILYATPDKITVQFDTVVSKSFSLSVSADEVQAEDGYIKGTPTVSPDKVTLTGPQASIDRVAKCVVKVDDSESRTETLVTDGRLELYDKDGTLIEDDNIEASTEKYTVTVPILEQKVLPVTFDYLNVPEGFDTSTLKYTMSQSTIEVAAPSSVLDNFESVNVGYVDFRQLDLNAVFNLSVALPDSFVNTQNVGEISISFDLSGYSSKTVRISNSNLKLVNVPENVDASVVTQYIGSVKIIGTPEDLATITASDVVGEIDLLEQKITEKGQFTVPVSVKIPTKSTVWAVGEYTAIVYASPK